MMQAPLLKVEHLKKYYAAKGGLLNRSFGWTKAVDDVSFCVYPGETLGLVGESGCGKTTTGKCILRLEEPTSGQIFYKGENITEASFKRMRKLRQELQFIFQDPYGSLNPRMTVGDIVAEPLTIHHLFRGREKDEKVQELLEVVGLNPYQSKRYPHEFSGGQRQRIGIARALALNPRFLVLDEPVSALDVSIQSQIINLLEDLQEKYGLTYVFIAHNLSVVQHISQKVGVMYLGHLLEFATCHDLYSSPLHPYTVALLSSIPEPDPDRKKKRIVIEGDVPSPLNPPSGCPFHTRCKRAIEKCREEKPSLAEVDPNHFVACHLVS